MTRRSGTSSTSTAATALVAGSRGIESRVVPVLLLVALIVSYWPTIVPLFEDWQNDQNYSVGQLVPPAALYLLWHDRKRLGKCKPGPCWWGVGVIVLAQLARVFGLAFLYESAERYALALTVVGLVLLVAGRQVVWQLRWILLFLFLMVPLPGRVHAAIRQNREEEAPGGFRARQTAAIGSRCESRSLFRVC